MTTRSLTALLPRTALGLLLIGLLVTTAAFAQGPGGPPPPFGQGPPPPPYGGPPPFGGPRGGDGRFGRRPPGGGPPPVTAARLPLGFLDAGLRLTSSQAAKITAIRQQARPPFGVGTPGGPWGNAGPSPDTEANRKIMAVLTAAQRQAMPGLIAKADALHSVGIPLEVAGELKMTSAQEKQLLALGAPAEKARKAAMAQTGWAGARGPYHDSSRQAREQTHAKAMALLSDSQRITVEEFLDAHPRPGPGGPGPDGFGPPPPPGGP